MPSRSNRSLRRRSASLRKTSAKKARRSRSRKRKYRSATTETQVERLMELTTEMVKTQLDLRTELETHLRKHISGNSYAPWFQTQEPNDTSRTLNRMFVQAIGQNIAVPPRLRQVLQTMVDVMSAVSPSLMLWFMATGASDSVAKRFIPVPSSTTEFTQMWNGIPLKIFKFLTGYEAVSHDVHVLHIKKYMPVHWQKFLLHTFPGDKSVKLASGESFTVSWTQMYGDRIEDADIDTRLSAANEALVALATKQTSQMKG